MKSCFSLAGMIKFYTLFLKMSFGNADRVMSTSENTLMV